jgi:hypothetical protein
MPNDPGGAASATAALRKIAIICAEGVTGSQEEHVGLGQRAVERAVRQR